MQNAMCGRTPTLHLTLKTGSSPWHLMLAESWISLVGTQKLVRSDAKMDGAKYRTILAENQLVVPEDFQHDKQPEI